MRLFSLINLFVLNYVLAHTDQVNRLRLNSNCSIHQDVRSIEHDFDHNLLRIKMKENRQCKSPSFMVRLSGSGLQLLEPVHRNQSLSAIGFEAGQDSLFTYRYEPVDQGAYFIEVMVLFCTSVDLNVPFAACMENVQHGNNVLNSPYSFNVTGPTPAQKYPRWVLNNKIEPEYLPTRYQKNDSTCATQIKSVGLFCYAVVEDILVHGQYDWANGPKYYDALKKMVPPVNSLTPENQPYIKICMIGASHARGMSAAGNTLLAMSGDAQFYHFEYIHVTFPVEFHAEMISTNACSYAIVTFGQWPFSNQQPNKNYTLSDYEAEMRQVFIQITTRTTALDTPVFMMSTNYNGLGGTQSSCPPTDHRTPPMLDLANGAVRKLSAEYSIGFIDLNHIIGPLWDGALDFCHPYGKVFTAEAQWILHCLVDYSVTHHQLPVIRSSPKYTVRFVDSRTVYLYQGNVMRAFPNGHTFMAMGYDFDEVVVMKEADRLLYAFRNDLPNL